MSRLSGSHTRAAGARSASGPRYTLAGRRINSRRRRTPMHARWPRRATAVAATMVILAILGRGPPSRPAGGRGGRLPGGDVRRPEVAERRPRPRRPFDGGGRQRRAAARVLLRGDGRRPLEDDRWRNHVEPGRGQVPDVVVGWRRGGRRVEPGRGLRRNGRDAIAGQHHPGRRRLPYLGRREDVGPRRAGGVDGDRPHPHSSEEPGCRVRGGPRRPVCGNRGAGRLPVARWRQVVGSRAVS